MHFVERSFMYYECYFAEVCFHDPVYWRLYAAPGCNEINYIWMRFISQPHDIICTIYYMYLSPLAWIESKGYVALWVNQLAKETPDDDINLKARVHYADLKPLVSHFYILHTIAQVQHKHSDFSPVCSPETYLSLFYEKQDKYNQNVGFWQGKYLLITWQVFCI